VKLLFDQNLSPRLVRAVEPHFPGSIHVRDVGLQAAADEIVWSYSADHEFVIVSKDSDFHQRSFLFGAPPKVIWLQCGNCSTAQIEDLLRSRRDEILSFEKDQEAAFLVIS